MSKVIVGILVGLALIWIALAFALWRTRPEKLSLHEVARLLPDTIRLLQRLARDNTLSRRVRWSLWALLAYLASPIDLIPDFIPVIGYADDAIVVYIGLRSVARHAGIPAIERHWPGTVDGLNVLLSVLRIEH